MLVLAQQPEQLPIVLQVLLSQAHRLRALKLLAQFLVWRKDYFIVWFVNALVF